MTSRPGFVACPVCNMLASDLEKHQLGRWCRIHAELRARHGANFIRYSMLECDGCGDCVRASTFDEHTAGESHRVAVAKREFDSRGLQRISESQAAWLERVGVAIERIAPKAEGVADRRYGVWAPRWAAEALKNVHHGDGCRGEALLVTWLATVAGVSLAVSHHGRKLRFDDGSTRAEYPAVDAVRAFMKAENVTTTVDAWLALAEIEKNITSLGGVAP